MEAHLRFKRQMNSAAPFATEKRTVPKKAPKPKHRAIPEPEPEPPMKSPIKANKPKAEPRIDFIQRNIEEAADAKTRAHKPKPGPKKYENAHKPGEIPKFITRRKEEIEAEHAPIPESKCPPGMRLLSDEEKMDAILNLKEQKEAIEAQLAKAPLRIESPQLLRQKRMLEQELTDIDASIDQLSRQYVFVPEDD